MDSERLAEIAHLYGTEGLEGEDLTAFEAWCATATPQEKAGFAAMVDSPAALTCAELPNVPPSPGVKDRLLSALPPRGQSAASPAGEPSAPPAPLSYLLRDEGRWVPLPLPGARLKELSARKEDGVTVFLLVLDPDTHFPSHHHHGTEMTYLLEGDLHTDDRILAAGDFLRAGAGSEHAKLYTHGGCRALLITASENFPRRSVGFMKRLQDVARACKDLLGTRKP